MVWPPGKLRVLTRPGPIGGTYANGWITAKARTFGDYTVMLDTVPPKIVPIDRSTNKGSLDTLKFRVGDDLSGIDKYVGQLDGAWILFEYDPKKGTLTHRFDTHSDRKGEHTLTLAVSDERGNKTTYNVRISR